MTNTSTATRPRSAPVERFAYFWRQPNVALLQGSFAEDVVGYFPGEAEPVRGPEAYIARIGQFLEALPDIRIEVAEHATNGEFVFIRWIARATGANGSIEFSGIDRIHTRDGLVRENIVVYDNELFQRLVYGKR